MPGVASRYAARSVRRNLRRTALSIVGIAVGCVLALVMESLNRGRNELFARAGASSGIGHLEIVPAGWPERHDPRLRLADWERDLAAVRSMPGVAAATARARAQVLLAMGTHVVPVEMVGVEPAVEPQTLRYVRHVASGRYLEADETGEAVVGAAIADRLSAGIDDDIVATAVGPDGEIESAMFRIVGIVRTGSDDVDATLCQVARPDLERFTGMPGAGEIAIVLRDYRQLETIRSQLVPLVASGDRVLTLVEVAPEIEGHLEQDAAATRFVSSIILLIVVLGVASAQLAAVLERRREFAVLSALGMSTGSMVRLVIQEALMLGTAGALAALALGLPIVWRLASAGLDFSSYLGSAWAMGGILFDPIIFGDLGVWIIPYVFVVAIGATVVASIYPAWFAARTDPAVALRVAQ
jgi:ABC-type lipoprotein release transport system permease subunit